MARMIKIASIAAPKALYNNNKENKKCRIRRNVSNGFLISLSSFKSIHYVCVGTHHPAGLLFHVVLLFFLFFFDEGVHTGAPFAVDDLQYK